ncbi:hypothetical protein KR009_001184 [Drosophila setifemur]|nr:hypothetical protein KR009_001184 [Drosophila setifemur]
MERKAKSIKESPTDEEFLIEDEATNETVEMEVEKLDNTGSSNEDSEEESDRKNDGSISAEMDENNEKEQEVFGGQGKDKEEDLRKMNELSLLSPAAMVALIQRLETQLYELGQREARELTRSKHLRIFGNIRRRPNK